MPTGYLVTVTLAAVVAGFSLVAPRRPPCFARASFRLSMLVNDTPWVGVWWLVAATALAAIDGDLDSAGGAVGLGIAALTIGALIAIAWRAASAGPLVERALADTFGSAHDQTAHRPAAIAVRNLFVPRVARRGDVERTRDLAYGDAGKFHRLDVYRHRSRPERARVFVHFHGGQLVQGSKSRDGLPFLYALASRGWTCISANYRLAPTAAFPEHLIDVKRVLAWVRTEGERFGADPATVFVAGDSAGAQLAALAAFTADDARYQPGFEAADTSVTAVVCLSGFYGWRGVESEWFPIERIVGDAPPFFVVHGDHDTMVPLQGARDFVAALRAASTRPVLAVVLPGAQHTFDLHASARTDAVVQGIQAFADAVGPPTE